MGKGEEMKNNKNIKKKKNNERKKREREMKNLYPTVSVLLIVRERESSKHSHRY